MSGKATKIADYLEGPKTWADGLKLYQKYGENRALKRIFERSGHTMHNHQRLLDELRKMAGNAKSSSQEKSKPAAKQKENPGLKKDDPRLFPLYRERQQLHAQLMLFRTDKERKEAALRILEITREVDRLQYEQVDKVQPSTQLEMHQRLMTNRAYISKNKSKENKQEEVTRRIQENQQIQKLLKQ
jgi:hypothetical protein